MADPRKTPWLVLGLDPSWFTPVLSYADNTTSPADQATRAALVRRAYRRALLQHHPDKHSMSHEGASVSGPTTGAACYTVDDIKAAYVALVGDAPTTTLSAPAQPALDTTATGLEIVDLDELPYDEASQMWYRACRCGNGRGYTFGERDLEEELDAEAMEELLGASGASTKPATIPAGELLVGCQDCSLWLCVHFAVALVGGEDNDEDEVEGEE
ncbi:Diphthamide biosynthesis protein 4 [Sporothrix curviconia]|uniref:Diphthamide biosynthesis protein 4 n=1 Tax=Sporothrix curviconia TaxID=1260050 RepID=A0ABP0BYL2_9PEZI